MVDVTNSDQYVNTTAESATLHITSIADNSEPESDGANLTNFTTTEDIEKEAILNTIKDFVEETTIYTLFDEPMTMKNGEIKEIELKLVLPEDTNEKEITTIFPEEELTTTRRLPERYMRKNNKTSHDNPGTSQNNQP